MTIKHTTMGEINFYLVFNKMDISLLNISILTETNTNTKLNTELFGPNDFETEEKILKICC